MAFPKLVKVRQEFPRPRIEDVREELRNELRKEEISSRIKPGMRVAITAGSRGISGIDLILRTLIEALKEAKVEPFIVPAMGSHGGATAEGQVAVLEGLGITEELVGAPVYSSMEVMQLSETKRGTPVYMDRLAAEADGVILVGRVKPHTSFQAEVESGLCKMASIGLGKHQQALALHAYGVEGIRDYMTEVAEEVLNSGKVTFGIGIVENAYEETAVLKAIPPDRIMDKEKELLKEAARLMPKLPVSDMDVLFVDELGKDYSGTGIDTNVIGRFRILGIEEPASPNVKYVIVSAISEKSLGNANGMGLADFSTRRFFENVDLDITNQNVLTSTFVERAKVPMILDNDREALEAAIRCNWGVAPEDTRFVRIPNTLELRQVYLSENLVEEALEAGNVEVIDEASGFQFGDDGYFVGFSEDTGRAVRASSEPGDGLYAD
ncbi:MAG: lactate racemase domain-containing protein [Rubrobacteraceae bacterium]